jgi:hypothetical protein
VGTRFRAYGKLPFVYWLHTSAELGIRTGLRSLDLRQTRFGAQDAPDGWLFV